MSVSRRDFVGAALSGVGAIWITGALACREKMDPAAMTHGPPVDTAAPPRVLQFLTPDEAREVEAFTSRIIPTTDTPGAREAGVVWFIDGAMVSFASEEQPNLRAGLAALAVDVAKAYPGRERFSALTEAEQDAFLRTYEKTELFGALRFGTIAGMFALPKYGGNANYIGWELIGQERGYEFKPPFGWYDRPENQRALLGRVL
jgi:gluconate 2-dehydrogenase gamma chain